MVSASSHRREPLWLGMFALLGVGSWLLAVCWHEWLCDSQISSSFSGEGIRRGLVRLLGGRLIPQPTGTIAQIPFENVLAVQVVGTVLAWLGGAAVLAIRLRNSLGRSLLDWGLASGGWLLLAGSWTVWRLLASLTGWTSAEIVLNLSAEMWLSCAWAGWCATFVWLLSHQPAAAPSTATVPASHYRIPPAVWIAIGISTLTFGIMNSLLYWNLQIPHGDSAMYEEHLWNLLQGKGFRSDIDKGLFLGEHIQVIHLGLIPLYLLWPSHLLLEWCESFGLALGAVPVFRMAVRRAGSELCGTQNWARSSAACLACAYLLYLPMQRLDISIDFKTFRPEAFGIPLLLAAFDALDQRRWRAFGLWLFAALLVKEDYALIIGPLGVWIAGHEMIRPPGAGESLNDLQSADGGRGLLPNLRSLSWKRAWPGIALSLAAVAYLGWAVKIAIPYFKAGNEVHYAKYFSQFGQTTNEIVFNLIRHPEWLLRELFTPENFLFATALGFGLAWLPLMSPGRLAVGAPLFAALCLNQIARNTQHHFHAPLVAIVFWAAAHGLANCGRVAGWLSKYRRFANITPASAMRFVAVCVFFTAAGNHFWHSFTPAGLPFWDATSSANWQRRYVPTDRVTQFAQVLRRIPQDRRVASTDFVHPQFNHHLRSYDYSSYRPEIPADVEFLVIDVRGPYSQVSTPLDVPAYRDDPARWELLPDDTHGYFYVFQSRTSPRN